MDCEMSMLRSISASEICRSDERLSEDMENCRDTKDDTDATEIMPKAQTLDRFARPLFLSHGEKRKKNFFSSFRLSKKAFSRSKEDTDSSLDALQTVIKQDEDNSEKCLEVQSKPRKRYLLRMSSLVNRVTVKVQNGEQFPNRKLERSQTLLGNELTPKEVEYVTYSEKVPGLVGIRNHGNTCFINAVIQCLNHTDILAEYFVLDQYKNDLARSNRIHSKKFGTKGDISEHLAILLKSLWMLKYTSDVSLNFKNVVEKYEPLYIGSNQHDAAEFLMFVLDKVHEDLNTASKKKYKKIKNSYGRPDEIVAAETLANHLRCNSSFVQAIFQAQFRSSLKCPHCLRESNTFDPYLFVSIPIPQKEILSIFITVVYLNQQPKQVKLGITMEATATIKELRVDLAVDCGIREEDLVLTEIDGEGFHRTFADNGSVNMIKSTDPIYGIELVATSSDENAGFLLITWINVLNQDDYNIRFGGVYQSLVARDISYGDLQKLLLKEMCSMVTTKTLVSEQESGIFSIYVSTGREVMPLLDKMLELPLFDESIEEALTLCHSLVGNPHVKFVLKWEQNNKEKYIIDDVDHVDEHATVDELHKNPPESPPVSLNDCLQLHTSTEMLSCGDAWHCPTCNRKQQVLKRLTLWSAPQVLVLHLKRFKQSSLDANSSKLTTEVKFPLSGFDISEHMAVNAAMASEASDIPLNSKAFGGVWSPWKRTKKCVFTSGSYIYDLYAVCNHHGKDVQGGHYTATCKNPAINKWHHFDDFNYEEISPKDVISQNAYILFYQRREDISSPDSKDGLQDNHWSFKIPLNCVPSNLINVSQLPNGTEEPLASDSKTIIDSKTKEVNGIYEECKNVNEELTKEKIANAVNPKAIPIKTSLEAVSHKAMASSLSERLAVVPDEKKFSTSAPEQRIACVPSFVNEEKNSLVKQESTPEVHITPASEEVSREYRAKMRSSRADSRPPSVCSKTDSRPPSVCSKPDSRPPSVSSKTDSRPPSVSSKTDSRPPSVSSKTDSRHSSVSSRSDSRPVSVASNCSTIMSNGCCAATINSIDDIKSAERTFRYDSNKTASFVIINTPRSCRSKHGRECKTNTIIDRFPDEEVKGLGSVYESNKMTNGITVNTEKLAISMYKTKKSFGQNQTPLVTESSV